MILLSTLRIYLEKKLIAESLEVCRLLVIERNHHPTLLWWLLKKSINSYRKSELTPFILNLELEEESVPNHLAQVLKQLSELSLDAVWKSEESKMLLQFQLIPQEEKEEEEVEDFKVKFIQSQFCFWNFSTFYRAHSFLS